MDKAKLAEMLRQVETLVKAPSFDAAQRAAIVAQIALFKTKIEGMSLIELFTKANKIGMAELASLRAMSAKIAANPLTAVELKAQFVQKAASVMKAFLTA